jgi:ubiquinone/menaquinone biosynthesis C-methylase UbiE
MLDRVSPGLEATLYVCPRDGGALEASENAVRCRSCDSAYAVADGGIHLLDVVQRPDNTAFDGEARSNATLTAEQRSRGILKASKMLDLLDVELLRNQAILEVGCGMGDLTFALATTGRLSSCDVYAFDHSLESLRVALHSIKPRNGNRLHLSSQDAAALAYGDECFNLVLGSAVLHHILDYRGFLASLYRILKPGGRAVFSEPFAEGYIWPCAIVLMACRALNVEPRAAGGLAEFILNDTSFRLQNASDLAALEPLTDKHYFRNDSVSALALELGFRKATFQNYEPPEFYDNYMDVFIQTYGIDNPDVVALSRRFYLDIRSFLGSELPNVLSHFKYLVLEK